MHQQLDLFANPNSGSVRAVAIVTQQTGWNRPGPVALCQNREALLAIAEFDFVLSDPGFQAYAKTRGILHVAGMPGSRRWKFTANHAASKESFLNNAYFRFAREYRGTSYMFTPEEMETHWLIMRLAKAKLQDCWDLYRAAGAHRK